jgi:Ser/Thr protein kinase RdoA (MazF antagonist)
MTSAHLHPYTALTPDVVQDALASIGLWGDGRLQALNSFENRVYQIHLETPCGRPCEQVVAKFYRPERWSDAQIAEEHALAAELVAADIPAVPPLVVNGATLHHFGGFARTYAKPSGLGAKPQTVRTYGKAKQQRHGGFA